jgi:hypothetical protein
MSTIKSSDEHLTLNADGSSKDIKFQANGVEKASIDSSGNLTVSGNLTSLGIDDNADATAITIDSRENVGIGVTPENDWYNGGVGSEYRILQLGTGAAVGGYADNSTYLGSNWKDNASNKYINTDEASLYKQQAGVHSFLVAPSGSADSAISWTTAMTIDNNGHITAPKQPAFQAGCGTNIAAASGRRIVVFDTTTSSSGHQAPFNIGSHYSTSTGRFTAPVDGVYTFWAQILFQGVTNGTNLADCGKLFKNGTGGGDLLSFDFLRWYYQNTYTGSGGYVIVAMQCSTYLSANDYVVATVDLNHIIHGNPSFSFFNGHLIG